MDLTDALLVVALVLLALAVLGWWRAHTRVRRNNTRRLKVAFAGEDAADAVLAAHGFEVLDHQVIVEFPMELDGAEVWVQNRADRVVQRDGRIYVADVKTGDRARDPTTPATRRQLLEYWLSHEADGILLVDMEAQTVTEVSFPAFPGPR
ncbi:MAG: PD-(D/E)XK nuclease family protein [Myxococcota bacterium]